MYDAVTASVTVRCAGPPYASIRSRAFRSSDCLTEEDTPLKPRSIHVQAPRAKRVNPSIVVLGTNYVGLVTAACLAQLGHTVIGVDIDPLKVARLQRGQLPIYEPGLEAIVVEQLGEGRLSFTLDYAASLPQA